MKRFRLPKSAKAAIRAWLELPSVYTEGPIEKIGVCPFSSVLDVYDRDGGSLPCGTICRRMFPSTSVGHCPCHVLTLSYVIKRAKETIR